MKHPNTLKGRRQLAAAAVFVITTLGLATGILAEDRTTEQAKAVVGRAAIAPAPGMPSLRRLRRSLTQDGSACAANESCGFVS